MLLLTFVAPAAIAFNFVLSPFANPPSERCSCTVVPSTANTPADTLVIVVSVACPTSSDVNLICPDVPDAFTPIPRLSKRTSSDVLMFKSANDWSAVAPVSTVFNLFLNVSVNIFESFAAPTAALISAFDWSAVAEASIPSNLE